MTREVCICGNASSATKSPDYVIYRTFAGEPVANHVEQFLIGIGD